MSPPAFDSEEVLPESVGTELVDSGTDEELVSTGSELLVSATLLSELLELVDELVEELLNILSEKLELLLELLLSAVVVPLIYNSPFLAMTLLGIVQLLLVLFWAR